MEILAAAPSNLELAALEGVFKKHHCPVLASGIGPVMTAHVLTRHFEVSSPDILVLCGLGGLYAEGAGFQPEVLLAETEVMADFGRCTMDSVQGLDIEGEDTKVFFDIASSWEGVLAKEKLVSAGFRLAKMATLSCASGDESRARVIPGLFGVQVENMEGAAAALVCRHYGVSLYEFRAISNIAGEPDHSKWRIKDALDSLCREVDRFLALLYR